jgi:hypothetical protein
MRSPALTTDGLGVNSPVVLENLPTNVLVLKDYSTVQGVPEGLGLLEVQTFVTLLGLLVIDTELAVGWWIQVFLDLAFEIALVALSPDSLVLMLAHDQKGMGRR